MKQVFIKKNRAYIEDIPYPVVSNGGVLVKVMYSCISDEIEIWQKPSEPFIKNILAQPDNIKTIISKIYGKRINTDIDMNPGEPVGCSISGIVMAAGKNVRSVKPGDRVACYGPGYAYHAEFIDVPESLAVKIPADMDFKVSSTIAAGAASMRAVRRCGLHFGEIAAVMGLGAIGQIAAQILKSSGCRVICIDQDSSRLDIAKTCGCSFILNSLKDDVEAEVEKLTAGYGIDAVIITGSICSKDVLAAAYNICRKNGKIILSGTIDSEFKKNEIFKKELDFLISTSQEIDKNFNEVDMPYAYIRWTDKRNITEYLRLIKDEEINLEPIINKIYDIEDASSAYDEFKKTENKPIMVLLKYGDNEIQDKKIYIKKFDISSSGKINVALIGAGSMAKSVNLPNLKKLNNLYNIYAVVCKVGASAKSAALEFGAKYAVCDYMEVLNDPDVDMVMICTRSNLHAKISIEAMKKGKAVYVAKPMALNEEELDEVLAAINETNVPYMVSLNRRFSRYTYEIKRCLENRTGPLIINYRMNDEYNPFNYFNHNDESSGKIISSGCSIFDFFMYLTNSDVENISVNSISTETENISSIDNSHITLKYKDGSLCSLTSTTLGNSLYPKEICEIYFDGKVIVLEDYKKLYGYGLKLNEFESRVPDTGELEELIKFAEAISNSKNYCIPVKQLEQSARLSFMAERELKNQWGQ
jgi:predicted dehydrogenase